MIVENTKNVKSKVMFVRLAEFLNEKKEYILPPNTIMSLATIANELNYSSFIFDYKLGGNIIEDISKISPHYLVAEISITNFKANIEIIKKIKQINPSICTILIGSPFITYNTNAIYENPEIDYIIIGEPEYTLRDILNSTPDENITGICYRKNFQAEKNEPRDFIEKLDLLKFPNRDLIDNTKYKAKNLKTTQALIKVSRGCNNSSFYKLSHINYGNKERFRSIKNIVEEIKICQNKYKINNFLISTDSKFLEIEWIKHFCNTIIENNLKITWQTDSYIEINSKEDAKLIYNSGCRMVDLNIESGSRKVLEKLGRKIDIEKLKKTIYLLHKYHIKISNNFIFGLPWDNKETYNETINFALSLKSHYINFYAPAPIPGTNFFAYSMLNQLVTLGFTLENAYYAPIAKTESLSVDEIKQLLISANKALKNPLLYKIRNNKITKKLFR